MKQKLCKVCGNEYRKGKLAFIMGTHGLQRVRVCQPCAGKGTILVAALPIVPCKCGKPATKCGACLYEAETKARAGAVQGAINVLSSTLKGMRGTTILDIKQKDFIEGKQEGIELALDMLKSGKF